MIDCTVIGGFLGSGKTTLINGLLSVAKQRIAVVVNDLGDLDLDADLLRGATSEHTGIVELSNGCICCTIGDSLAVTLRQLCQRPIAPERIIIECSGAAEPGKVAAYGNRKVLAEPGVVVTVDATDVQRRANDPRFGSLVRAQLGAAHLLVVTKTDLLDAAPSVPAAPSWLRQQQPEVPVIVANPADLGPLLTAVFDAEESGRGRARGMHSGPQPAVAPEALGAPEAPGEMGAVRVEAHTVPALTQAGLRRWLEGLAADQRMIRAKGIAALPAGPTLVQWAGGRVFFEPWAGPVRRLNTISVMVADGG